MFAKVVLLLLFLFLKYLAIFIKGRSFRMVKITNGKDVFEVTEGAFEGIFIHQGFVKYDETKVKSKDILDEAEIPVVDAADEFDELDEIENEKPVSQWTKAEVKEFAKANGIDISGTKNVNEAKEIIKQFIGA
jgi:hypothetical protein